MYGIIPSGSFADLNTKYTSITQIFKTVEDQPTIKLPFILLESDFTAAQIVEITINGGRIFESANEYSEWKEAQ